MTPSRSRPPVRRGSIIPMLAIFLFSLFAFVALAVDIGMIAVARTDCQNAADAAALTGARTLNNKPGVPTPSNVGAAGTAAQTVATTNILLNTAFTTTDLTGLEAGVYNYDPTSGLFTVPATGSGSWTNIKPPAAPSPPNGQSWTAVRTTININQPTYFARVLGYNSMPTGARAVAVHRPRDVAFVLDMTGSMSFASQFNYSNVCMNPDDLIPRFGHYANVQGNIRQSANQTNGSNEAISRNNFTITTPSGPPMVRGYFFDPVNLANPTVAAHPVTLVQDPAYPTDPTKLRPESSAFHRSNVTESGGDSTTYTPPVYDFTNYDPFANTKTEGATPAPDWYGDQTDNGSKVYPGDRTRRVDGAIYKASTSWTAGATRAAGTARELLGYGANPPTGSYFTTALQTDWSDFRDQVWEKHGYDLDIPKYRAWKATAANAAGANNPGDPADYEADMGGVNNVLLPAADRFKGYSMGPGYWGKTFFMWPPDPRADRDWRLKFFQRTNGSAFDPQGDSRASTTGAGNIEGVNEVLFRNGSGITMSDIGSTTTPTWRVNYPAVLAWLKQAGTPQVLPPNLRAGRVVYYTSIPDTVVAGGGDARQELDKVFWKNYIDYVLGWNYNSTGNLYGAGDSWSAAARSLYQSDIRTYQYQWEQAAGIPASKPYMNYRDSPMRPRLHFWFGPLSMMDFVCLGGGTNWTAGTIYEAQSWQLKAAMNSVLDDVRNNHPNDSVGMAMFAASQHIDPRVPMGQSLTNFTALKNALFYPRSLLTAINGGDTTTELRPYNAGFGGYSDVEIPNAVGSTDPNTGLALAFNLLSPSTSLPAAKYGTVKGRRGASKIVIFETDGVPNTYRTMTFNQAGYNSYYTIGGSSGNIGNGNATVMTEAKNIVTQMVRPMATTTSGNSGLGLPNTPCRVYPIAFGDLFDTNLAPTATFRGTALQFMVDCAAIGGTGPAAGPLPPDQIITGQYQDRINNMKACMERIFSSGVSVTLIE